MKNLIKNEQVIFIGKISLWSLLGELIFGTLFLALGVGLLFYAVAYLKYSGTVLALTDKRIIGKAGLIYNIRGVNLNRVDEVKVNQSILGVFFNYGTIEVLRDGHSRLSISGVADPLSFRKILLEYQGQISRLNMQVV